MNWAAGCMLAQDGCWYQISKTKADYLSVLNVGAMHAWVHGCMGAFQPSPVPEGNGHSTFGILLPNDDLVQPLNHSSRGQAALQGPQAHTGHHRAHLWTRCRPLPRPVHLLKGPPYVADILSLVCQHRIRKQLAMWHVLHIACWRDVAVIEAKLGLAG